MSLLCTWTDAAAPRVISVSMKVVHYIKKRHVCVRIRIDRSRPQKKKYENVWSDWKRCNITLAFYFSSREALFFLAEGTSPLGISQGKPFVSFLMTSRGFGYRPWTGPIAWDRDFLLTGRPSKDPAPTGSLCEDSPFFSCLPYLSNLPW